MFAEWPLSSGGSHTWLSGRRLAAPVDDEGRDSSKITGAGARRKYRLLKRCPDGTLLDLRAQTSWTPGESDSPPCRVHKSVHPDFAAISPFRPDPMPVDRLEDFVMLSKTMSNAALWSAASTGDIV